MAQTSKSESPKQVPNFSWENYLTIWQTWKKSGQHLWRIILTSKYSLIWLSDFLNPTKFPSVFEIFSCINTNIEDYLYLCGRNVCSIYVPVYKNWLFQLLKIFFISCSFFQVLLFFLHPKLQFYTISFCCHFVTMPGTWIIQLNLILYILNKVGLLWKNLDKFYE